MRAPVGDNLSASRDAQKDMLLLQAYSTLANFWLTLSGKGDVGEEDAQAMLKLQHALITQLDATLQAHVDEPSLKHFREFVEKFRVRMS